MEPTPIVPPVVTPSNKRIVKIIIVILALVLIVIAYTAMKNKTEAPSDTTNSPSVTAAQNEIKQLSEDINSATIFDNESSLAEIDKQFQ